MSRLEKFRTINSRANVSVGLPVKVARDKANDFAQVPLDLAADFAKATNTSSAMVWVLLIYLAWKKKSLTFSLSNEILARHGVTRWAKYRVLAALERAEKIKVQYHGKRAPDVTLLVAPRLPK